MKYVLSHLNMWKPQCKLVELYFTHIIYGKCSPLCLLYIRYHPAFKLVYSQ